MSLSKSCMQYKLVNIAALKRCLTALVFLFSLVISLPASAQDEPVASLQAELSAAEDAPQVMNDNEAVQQPGEAVEDSLDEPAPVEISPVETAIASPESAVLDQAQPQPADEQLLPEDLSPWGMFISADWVVKAVMLGLVLASLLTWTALIAKAIEFAKEKRFLKSSHYQLSKARTLAEASKTHAVSGIGRELISSVQAELECSNALIQQKCNDREAIKSGIKERMVSSLSRIEAAYSRQLIVGTGLLATIGATAPFVGLFGTVWGIMNSFIGISQSNTTNLAVVAPGIAEALLATAMGLVAAIPAVVIYNHFTRQVIALKAMAADCSAALMRLVSRDLDKANTVRPAASDLLKEA